MKQQGKRKIGLAIGSGGVYAAAALGVFEILKKEKMDVEYIGGASGGAIIAALCFLEGNPESAKEKFLEKLPAINKIKMSPFGKQMDGTLAKEIINDILDDKNWKDGKLKGACIGAMYQDTKEPLVLTKNSGLSLVDAVLASISLKMIEPIVKLNGRIIAHGGETYYINGLRKLGSNFVLEVSPNLENGVMGKIASIANTVSSALILKGDFFANKKDAEEKANDLSDFSIHPNLSLNPFISPLNFSERNVNFMIQKGNELMEQSISDFKKVLQK